MDSLPTELLGKPSNKMELSKYKEITSGGINWEIGIDLCTLLTICKIDTGLSLVAQLVKNLPANARDRRDVGSIPG